MPEFKVFFSATHKSGRLYTTYRGKLERMEKDQIIKLYLFPLSIYIKEENYFPKLIMNSIDDSDILVALLDEKGRESQWVNQEVGYAMAKKVEILALADYKEKLRGFVNMQTKTILEGGDKPLPEEMEKALMDFWEEKEDEIYEKILLSKIPEMKKIIELEESELLEPKFDVSYRLVKRFKENVDGLIDDYLKKGFSHGFFKIVRLKQIKDVDFPAIKHNGRLGITKRFKEHCKEFEIHIDNLIDARHRKFE